MTAMSEAQRLALIIEAVRYCRGVKQMGMPASCYSKALREPVHFLWSCRRGSSKEKIARYRSRDSVGLKFGGGRLVFDHAIPFNYLESELLGASELTSEAVREKLRQYSEVFVLITKEENDRINASGLGSKMPDQWDQSDPLARCRAVGIELVENKDTYRGS
jgi:hypothetical protein